MQYTRGLEVDTYIDRDTDMPVVKLRYYDEDGKKYSIRLLVEPSELPYVAEGCTIPIKKLDLTV